MSFLRVIIPVALLSLTACERSHLLRAPTLTNCATQGSPTKQHLRMVSFNIRSGLSSSMEEIGRVLEELDPDVVALQEVDVGVKRTQNVDQATVLAERLGAERIFAGAIKREGGDYGVAILSRLPVARADRIELGAPAAFEPRVAVEAGVCVNGQEINVVALHADVFPWSASANSRDLAKHLKGSVGKGVLVAGDLNETSEGDAVKAFTGLGLVDVLGHFNVGPTFPGSNNRIDYILADDALAPDATSAGAVPSAVSDHLPVFAQFDLPQLVH